MSGVDCDQCGMDINPHEPYTVVFGTCDSCGEFHPLALVHLMVCQQDKALGETREASRKRRAGAMRLN